MAGEKLRIDRWMWFARVAKTRTLAQKLIRGGRVRVNREKISNVSTAVTVGDVLTINIERAVLVYEIVALGKRRGPYSEAQLLYTDLSPKIPETVKVETEPKIPRPDKRQRRILKEMKSLGNFGE